MSINQANLGIFPVFGKCMSPTQCYDTSSSRSIQLALAVSSGLYYLLGSLTVINTAARTDRKFDHWGTDMLRL